ncbi:MAG: hypothetical protein P4M11_00030, partial [Candidatus Pacebacteria bacterium]|nr:hypothetical protein [Candidatus Paceibacterota bacterium]
KTPKPQNPKTPWFIRRGTDERVVTRYALELDIDSGIQLHQLFALLFSVAVAAYPTFATGAIHSPRRTPGSLAAASASRLQPAYPILLFTTRLALHIYSD